MRRWFDPAQELYVYRYGDRPAPAPPTRTSCSSPSCSDNPRALAGTRSVRLDAKFWTRQLRRAFAAELAEARACRALEIRCQGPESNRMDERARALERQARRG